MTRNGTMTLTTAVAILGLALAPAAAGSDGDVIFEEDGRLLIGTPTPLFDLGFGEDPTRVGLLTKEHHGYDGMNFMQVALPLETGGAPFTHTVTAGEGVLGAPEFHLYFLSPHGKTVGFHADRGSIEGTVPEDAATLYVYLRDGHDVTFRFQVTAP